MWGDNMSQFNVNDVFAFVCFGSGQGETVISILIEFHKFWAYDNREAIAGDTNHADEHNQTNDPATVSAVQPPPPPLDSAVWSPMGNFLEIKCKMKHIKFFASLTCGFSVYLFSWIIIIIGCVGRFNKWGGKRNFRLRFFNSIRLLSCFVCFVYFFF